MKIIDRYLVITVLKATFFMILALTTLVLVFAYRGQIDDTDQGTYTSLKALVYVLLLAPTNIVVILPVAALLGVLVGIGGLASHNELTVLRASGMSPKRIACSISIAGIIIALLGLVIGDQVAPKLADQATNLRNTARAGGVAQDKGGVWLPSKTGFVYVGSIPNSNQLLNLRIYTYEQHDTNGDTNKPNSEQTIAKEPKISSIAIADRAEYVNDEWHIFDYQQSTWHGNHINTIKYDEIQGGRLTLNNTQTEASSAIITTGLEEFTPEKFAQFKSKARTLSLLELREYSSFLKERGIRSESYDLAFWQGIAKPFSVLIMVLLPLPFLFGSMRSMGSGQRFAIGIAAGLIFYVSNIMLSNTGKLFGLDPILAAWLPTLVFAVIAFVGLQRIR